MARRRKPQKPTVKTTADYLALAAFTDLLPQDPQTCEDYGFDRAVTFEEKGFLLGLYMGLIKIMEISPETIHDWRIRGVLVDEIKAAFYKNTTVSREAYNFHWFLNNQHIVALAGKPLSAKEMRDHDDTMLLRVWKLAGGWERDPRAIRAAIERKPAEEQKCYRLYTFILSGQVPPPSLDLWIDFGFASCIPEGESILDANYRALIASCTFKEFCNAYRNRRLLDLFHSKGLHVFNKAQLQDLLSGDLPLGCRKSVWDLKQFVLQETPADEEASMAPMAPSVTVDYGFINCKNASETRQLKQVYKDFFTDHRGDPLALHEAAIKGNLYSFLSNIMHHLQGPKYQRLMVNHHPLPDKSDVARASVATEPDHPWVPFVDEPRESWFSPWQVLALLLIIGLGGILLAMFWIIMIFSVVFWFVALTCKYWFFLLIICIIWH